MPRKAQAVVFDLDDTLAPSKSPMDDRMAETLVRLLDHVQVCIISGGRFEQFQALRQRLARISSVIPHHSRHQRCQCRGLHGLRDPSPFLIFLHRPSHPL